MRLFIGISLPDPITSHLSTLRGSLPSVHWKHPDTYHLTLCFIGEIKNHHIINELDLALEKITFPHFEMTIGEVGFSTSSTHENTFWASVFPSHPLINLKKKIEHTLCQFDIKPKKQRFTPHITLAKGSELNEEQISNWIYKYNLFKTEPFEIYQFSLFSSYPEQDETSYIIEANYPLR